MIFNIDYRENKILNEISGHSGIECNIEPLQIGDFYFQSEDYHLIIERKTWNDLHSSIRDDRFREQRSRLLLWKNESENRRVMYIIEGEYEENFEKEKITSHRLMIGYSIPVIYTKSLKETTEWLVYCYNLKTLDRLFKTRSVENDQVESRLSKLPKKNYMDSKLFLLENMTSIRGVTFDVASKIVGEYNSIKEFIIGYKEEPKEFINRLENIRTKSDKKLSKTIINKIILNYDLKESTFV